MSHPARAEGLGKYDHHHVVAPAQISLTLSRHSSLSFIASGRSPGLHTVSSRSCCMYARAGRPAFVRPYEGVNRSTYELLQQCPACLVRLTWIVFVMGGKWSYSWCWVLECTTWTLTKRLEKKIDGNYTKMLRAMLNKSWRQHPTKHQLYGNLPPITKTVNNYNLQLYRIKYSYQMQMIFKQIYSTRRWDPNRYYHLESMKGYSTILRSPQMCNIMAEGFRFMPLGLVRLRTFRLSTWVS